MGAGGAARGGPVLLCSALRWGHLLFSNGDMCSVSPPAQHTSSFLGTLHCRAAHSLPPVVLACPSQLSLLWG